MNGLESKSDVHLNCLICNIQIIDTPVSAHVGTCEPYHKECLKTQLKISHLCPSCHEPVNFSLFFSWKERTLIQINLAKLVADTAVINVAKTVARVGLVAGVLTASTTVILPVLGDKLEWGLVGGLGAVFATGSIFWAASLMGVVTRELLTYEDASQRRKNAAEAFGSSTVLLVTGASLGGIGGVATIFAGAAAGAALEGAVNAIFEVPNLS